MKKILIVILFCFSITYISAQPANLDWYVGTWKYENTSTGEELIIKLKKSQEVVPPTFGGGIEECLVGVYRYKKNNLILADKLDLFNENLVPFGCPGTISIGRDISHLMLCIKDYTITNGRGKYKTISIPSTVVYNTSSPKTIKWKLVVEEQEYFYYEQIDRFPEGTNLPIEIVLTKVE